MADNSQDNKRNIPPELGNLGIKIDFNAIYNDSLRDLQYPNCLKTFDEMARSSVIASTLAAINTIASQVNFFLEPYNQTQTHKDRKEFTEQCLFKDMETPFNQVLKDYLTSNQYGFAVLEKVFRFRYEKDGSIYNDGRIGIKYLPFRSQKSIVDYVYDDDNRKLLYLVQEQIINRRNNILGSINTSTLRPTVNLPIERILFFKVNQSSLYPFGKSPFSDAYTSWRVLEELRSIETTSANKNLNGIPYLKLPSGVMDEDEDDVTSVERRKALDRGLSRISTGEQSYIKLPSDRYSADEGGAALYEFGVVSGSSSHLTALSSIISRYKNEVFQAMCADVLIIDDGQSASSSLTTNKQDMLNMFVEARIKEFLDVINQDLIPDLFSRNGWDKTKLPVVKYGRIEKLTIAELAKAIQQLSATQTIPITAENTNYMAEIFGFPTRVPNDITFEELTKIRGYGLDMQSRSGDGMTTAGEGTSNTVSGRDETAANLDKS